MYMPGVLCAYAKNEEPGFIAIVVILVTVAVLVVTWHNCCLT